MRQPPAQQPQALQSPPDLSALYSDLMKYQSKENNINRGIGLIGSSISQDANRQATLNAFTSGGSGGGIDEVKGMAGTVMELQKMDLARQQRAQLLAAVPGIAKQYGISPTSAMILAQSGQLDEFVKEMEKPNSEIRETSNGQLILIDKTHGNVRGTFGGVKQNNQVVDGGPEGKFAVDLNNPAAGKSMLTGPQPDWRIVDDPKEGKVRVDINNPTNRTVLAGPDLSTPDKKNYDHYVADENSRGNNDPLSYQQWRMTKPPSTRITNQVGAEETAFGKEAGKTFAEDYQGFRKARQSARDMLNQYELAESALASGVNTGALGETEQYLRKIGAALGIDTSPEKVAGGEVLKTVTNRMALLMRNPDSGMGMPGSVSDRDLLFLKEAQVGMGTSKTGNQDLLRVFRQLEKRKIEIADLADEYVKKNKQLDAGFDSVVKQYADAHPLFEGFKIGGEQISREEQLKRAREKYQTRKP